MTQHKPKRGDIVAIPIEENKFAIAQVVDFYRREACLIVVFERLYSDTMGINLESAIREPVELVALTFDAKIYNGDWPLLGSEEPSPELALPAYRIGEDPVYVEDHTGQRVREASETDPELPFRTFVAPIVLEQAIRAKNGREAWDARYDALLPPPPWAQEGAIFPQA